MSKILGPIDHSDNRKIHSHKNLYSESCTLQSPIDMWYFVTICRCLVTI